MKQSNTLIPLYYFFNSLRANKQYALGLEEYFSLIKVLQTDSSFLDSKEKLYSLCKLLWFKPGNSDVFFYNFFNQAFEKYEFLTSDSSEEEIQKQESNPQTSTQRDDPKKEIKTNENQRAEKSQESDFEELYLNIIKKQTGQELHINKEEDLLLPYHFRFMDFFPFLNARMLKQRWRFLSNPFFYGTTLEIDIIKTISEYASKGYLYRFEYKKREQNTSQLIILIDHLGSMVAFKKLQEIFVQTAIESSNTTVSTFYFRDIPRRIKRDDKDPLYNLYKDEAHTEYVNFIPYLKKVALKEKNVFVLIISDAGASRISINIKRVDATYEFLEEINKITSKVAWLNPIPKDRWEETSASLISDFVFMDEANDTGLKNAIDIFRGKMVFKGAYFNE